MNTFDSASARDLLARVRTLRLLVIGDVMLDHYIWGDATRISPEAPVPVVDIARDSYVAGGAANVALNIVDLGARAEIAGWVGRDEAGARLLDIFAARGVRFDRRLFHSARRPTIVKTRVMVQRQQLCRLDREATPGAYPIGGGARLERLAAKVARCDAVLLSDYAKGLLDERTIEGVATAARQAGKLVALDPKPKRRLAFRNLDLITPNRREAAELAGMDLEPHLPFPAAEICRRIHERFAPRRLVITLGEDGMLLSEEGRVLGQIPTAAREVFDVSGAGDTALAGLVLALAAGADLEAAAHFANAAAGVVVAKVGTATVTPAELLAHLERTP